MILTNDNLSLFAAKNYLNEFCLSIEEFNEDLAVYKLAQKMAKKIPKGRKTNIRLLCNHVQLFTNNFEIQAAKHILFHNLSDEEKTVMKTILNYFGFLAPNEMPEVKFHLVTAKLLKEMDK